MSCARDFPVEPATLVRATRDFAVKELRFAAEIGLVALQRLLDGSGYDPAVSLSRRLLTISWMPHRGSVRGIGPKSRL